MRAFLTAIVCLVILLPMGCATSDTGTGVQNPHETPGYDNPGMSTDGTTDPTVEPGEEDAEDLVEWTEGVRLPRSTIGVTILPATLEVVEDQKLPDPNAYGTLYAQAATGDPNAEYALALCCLTKYALPEMSAWFEKAATQGHAKAQYALNICYTYGVGVVRDASTAFAWCQKAAEQGHCQAQIEVAFMYRDAKGTSQDYSEAAKWFAKAANQGHSVAQYQLARAYAAGWGLRRNDKEAVRWCTRAAEQGESRAQFDLGKMYYTHQESDFGVLFKYLLDRSRNIW